jgi:hypothetical protein
MIWTPMLGGFRCIRGGGRFFQAKGKNCKLASRRIIITNAGSRDVFILFWFAVGRQLRLPKHRPHEGRSLGRRDNCDRSVRTPILERPVLDIQNPGASDLPLRGDGGIRDHNDTLSSSKLMILGIRESETDIAAH